MTLYWQLFISFVQIGLLSFGGGYASLPLIQKLIVERHGWLTMGMFADLLAISEMTPGPIAINSATFVGLQVLGVPGALVATLGIILPSCVIVSGLALLYRRYHDMSLMHGILGGIQPAVVAMIASAGMGILVLAFWPAGMAQGLLAGIDWIAVALFAVSIFVLRKWRPNPIWIIVAAAVVGAVLYWLGLA